MALCDSSVLTGQEGSITFKPLARQFACVISRLGRPTAPQATSPCLVILTCESVTS